MSTYWHHRLREHEVNQMRERIGSGVQYEIAFFSWDILMQLVIQC